MAVIRVPGSLGNTLAANIPVDMLRKLMLYDADVTPLLAFQADLKKVRTAKQAKFNHLYSDQIALWSQVTTGGNSAAATIIVADGTVFNVNDVVVDTATSEHLLVTAVSTNTLTITRAFGSTSAATITATDYIVNLGSSFAEGGSAPDPLMLLETESFNYTQIFKQAVGVTGTAAASEFYVGPELPKRKAQALRDLKRKMEYASLFGEIYGGSLTGNQPQRTTRGLNAAITTNRFAIAGTLSQDYFVQSVLPDSGRYGSGKKVIYCGVNMLKCFADWGLDRLQTFTSDSMLGFKAREYISPFVDLMIVRHKMLEGPYAGYAFIVDPENSYRVDLNKRSLAYQENIQAPDYDGQKDQWLTESGFEFPLEKSHAVLTGITGPA